jgi:hypothetical protein
MKVFYGTLNIIEWLLIIIIKEKKDCGHLMSDPWTDFMVDEVIDVSNRLTIGNMLGSINYKICGLNSSLSCM